MSQLAFTAFSLNGVDAQKFLQGQVTVHVERLPENESRYTAICDLKGRIHFGVWIKRLNPESFELVTTQDQAEEFSRHIKKFGAFSKMKLAEVGQVFPSIVGNHTEFSSTETDMNGWQTQAIQSGQAWITQSTEHLFQPQELRLHQRDGGRHEGHARPQVQGGHPRPRRGLLHPCTSCGYGGSDRPGE